MSSAKESNTGRLSNTPSGIQGMSLDPLTTYLKPDEIRIVQVQIVNESDIVDHFTVAVEGLRAEWLGLPENGVELMPNQETAFSFTIGPIPDSTPCGTLPYRLILRSTTDPRLMGTAFGNLYVESAASYSAYLRPEHVDNSGISRFVIENSGNCDLQFTLGLISQEDALDVTVPSDRVVVESGGRVQLDLSVKPRNRPIIGTVKKYTFNIVVTPDVSESEMVEGTASVVPLFSRAMVAVLAIATMAILGAIVMLTRASGEQVAIEATQTAEAVTTFSAQEILAAAMLDEDGDHLSLSDEERIGTDPQKWDTDGDGLSDGEEYEDARMMHTDPLKADTDNDTLTDYEEVNCNPSSDGAARGQCTNPNERDTDGDGTPDNADLDSDYWPTPTPIPPHNFLQDASFEADTLPWKNSRDGVFKYELNVPIEWKLMVLDNVPVAADGSAGHYYFPEMVQVTQDQMSECQSDQDEREPICDLFQDDKILKVFKGGGAPIRFTLYRDQLLNKPGAYRFTVRYFADAVAGYEGDQKVWGNQGAAEVQLCIEGAEYDHRDWQRVEIGQVREESLDFFVPTPRTITLYASFKNPTALPNNGWFFDSWSLQQTLDWDDSMAGKSGEHGCLTDMSEAQTN